MSPTSILWLRRDLRLHDLPSLGAAADQGHVLPVFVLDERLLSESSVRTTCLLRALTSAQESYDGHIVIRSGKAEDVLPQLAEEVGASTIHISGESQPWGRIRDQRVRNALGEDIELRSTGSPYAVDPGTIMNQSGKPFQVYTPFSKAWRAHGWGPPVAVPKALSFATGPESLEIPEAPGVEVDLPEVGEDVATARWADFLDVISEYDKMRDFPALDNTSMLSMHLKFGTIHPRTLLADLDERRPGHKRFVSEIGWREFYADVLWHNPESEWEDLKPGLKDIPYEDPVNDEAVAARFAAWKEGRTGFPFVDAGMRQLASIGWMHNRVRMVVASFLTKDLHIWWPHGARHFMELLRDGDPASNSHGWQWTAGTGTDASPYFRVFNPVTQGLRFDPDGEYLRQWIPELRHLSGKRAHEPWDQQDGLDHGYPERIVDHAAERDEALERYGETKS
ncbi:MAG: cryptochrome/photolyase family protein [Arachnia sp.]